MAGPDDLSLWWSERRIADRNRLRDEALEDLEFERNDWVPWLNQQGLGFASGAVNPFGVTGWGARGLSHMGVLAPNTGRNVQDTLNRWDDEAPVAATLGTFMVPGFGLLRLAVRAGQLTRREAVEMLPYLAGMGTGVGNLRNVLSRRDERNEQERRAREYGAAGY